MMASWQEQYPAPHWQIIRRAASLAGRVIDAVSERPIEGALVAIAGPRSGQALSRPDGSFVFQGLSPGDDYELTASAPQFGGRYGAEKRSQIAVPAAGAGRENLIEIRLPPTRVEGVVQGKDETGKVAPLTGALVRLRGDGAALTDEQGAFRLSAAPPGQQTAEISASGYKSQTQTMQLEIGQVATLDLTLDPVPPT